MSTVWTQPLNAPENQKCKIVVMLCKIKTDKLNFMKLVEELEFWVND